MNYRIFIIFFCFLLFLTGCTDSIGQNTPSFSAAQIPAALERAVCAAAAIPMEPIPEASAWGEAEIAEWLQAWSAERGICFDLDVLPDTFDLCLIAYLDHGYYMFAGSDPTEPHGAALYLAEPHRTDAPDAPMTYRKCTIEIPEDISYDHIAYWPSTWGFESGGICYIGLQFMIGDTVRYIDFTAALAGEWPEYDHFGYAQEYPASYAENMIADDQRMKIFHTRIQ